MSSDEQKSPRDDAFEADDASLEREHGMDDTELKDSDGGFGDLFGEGPEGDTEHAPGQQEPPVETTDTIAMPKIPKRSRPAGGQAGPDTSRDGSTNGDGEDSFDGEAQEEHERQPQPANPKQAEIDELNRRIDAALKSGRGRKRRKAEEDDAAVDEMIVDLRKRMRDAAYHDIDDNKDRLPAIHKVAMLSDVVEELGKAHLYEAFLDNNIVDSLRLWLEPLDDGSLPSLDIQNALLDILKKLPIRRDHLRESGIGKIILFMSKCPRIPERNRRTCEQFVQQWSRMVLRLSSNFRDRRIKEASVALDRRHFAAASRQGGGTSSGEPRRAPGGVQVQSGSGKDGERATARIPQRVAASYSVMPVSSISHSSEQRLSGRDAQDKYKRLRQTMIKGGRKL